MLTSFCTDIYRMLSEKYPDRKIYAISDHHFYHCNIIKYGRDYFDNIEQMNDYIIRSHNATISPDDIVIFLGDFSFKRSEIKPLLERLNGHKFLVLGNHDPNDLVKNYPSVGFEGVFTSPVKLDDAYLSHEALFPGEKNNLHFSLVVSEFQNALNSINYHGHIHTKENINERYRNVTCEALDYTPIMIGKTASLEKEDKPLFINSPYLAKSLDDLKKSHGIDPRILLEDLIYATMLEGIKSPEVPYYIHGSYGLFKKYGFISNFSDLDLSVIYDKNIGKRANAARLKIIVDEAYAALQNIFGINLFFDKKYVSLRIFYALYTSQNPYFVACPLDANMIAFDCYKSSDFAILKKGTMIEKLLKKTGSNITDDFSFPSFESDFTVPTVDIVNMILQIIFQTENQEKKNLALKKLQYTHKQAFNSGEVPNFLETFIRFYLRNVALFHTWRRFDEIEYIQHEGLKNMPKLHALPVNLQEQIYGVIYDPEFIDVHNIIASVPPSETYQVASELIRKLK